MTERMSRRHWSTEHLPAPGTDRFLVGLGGPDPEAASRAAVLVFRGSGGRCVVDCILVLAGSLEGA